MMHTNTPIILAGLGRSGTSLLVRMFNAHPDLFFFAESNYLIPSLYNRLISEQNISRDPRLVELVCKDAFIKAKNGEGTSDLTTLFARAQEEKLGQIVADAIIRAHRVREVGKRYWGFKDIFNGVSHFAHDQKFSWRIYDLVFPKAYWVQVIRNPFLFARSWAGWSGAPLTIENLEAILRDWVDCLTYTRERGTTRRYFEFRYEDLIEHPRDALSPLFERLGLKWASGIDQELDVVTTDTKNKPVFPFGFQSLKHTIPKLAELMTELRYEVPADHGVQTRFEERMVLRQVGDGEWKIVSPPRKEIGACWVVELSALEPVADPLVVSPWGLFEDGVPLRYPRALHDDIRLLGEGRYSHWAQYLYFSTSDNSSPIDNGRSYTLRIAPERCTAAMRSFIDTTLEAYSAPRQPERVILVEEHEARASSNPALCSDIEARVETQAGVADILIRDIREGESVGSHYLESSVLGMETTQE